MKEFLKKSGYISLLSSIIFALIGIIIIVNPTTTLNVISTIIGISIIIMGVVKFFTSFSIRTTNGNPDFSMIFGSLIIIISGIVTICYSQTIQSIISILIGLWIIYSALVRFGFSMQIRTIGFPAFIISTILSIAMLVCGIYVLFNSSAIVVGLGVIMLVFAIIDIIEELLFISYAERL